MDAQQMKEALKTLDRELPQRLNLLIGGGAAFILAHHIPLLTMDIDGIPYKTLLKPADLDPYVKKVAARLQIPNDWLNSYFSTFTYSLPKDYGARLIPVFRGKKLTALALGKEDLLIMKCFAGREKDFPHARALLKQGLNTALVDNHLQRCVEENIPHAPEACDFFYDACEQLGISI